MEYFMPFRILTTKVIKDDCDPRKTLTLSEANCSHRAQLHNYLSAMSIMNNRKKKIKKHRNNKIVSQAKT